MRTAPSDLEIETIVAALTEGWGMHCPMLHYLPRGFGSHHWQAKEPDGTHWFVTVDDLRAGQLDDSEEQSFARLTSAFRTADALRHQARLDFVVSPVADAAGRVAVRLGDRYSLAVFPALDLEPRDSGEFRTASDREETLRLVGLVHLATDRIPHDGLRRDTLRIPNRSNLLGALRSLDRAWDGEPSGSQRGRWSRRMQVPCSTRCAGSISLPVWCWRTRRGGW